MSEYVSKKTRLELREYFVGTTLREIADAFDAADIQCDSEFSPPVSGARRSSVEQYYHSLDWSKYLDVKRFLTVYANVLAELEDKADHKGYLYSDTVKEWAKGKLESLKKWIERDGYRWEDGTLQPVGRSVDISDLSHAAVDFDVPHLQKQIDRARASIEDDPDLAVGTAKEIIETTCKTILTDRGIAYSKDASLTDLAKLTREALKLLPDDIPDHSKGSAHVQKVLGSLGAVAQGIAELRTLYGTGHGKEGKRKGGLSPRHARLAVSSAAALSMFLLETHEERGR